MSRKFVNVTTQAELDKALKDGNVPICTSGFFSVSAANAPYDSATVEAYDSATVRAYDSATVRAYDSATVEAYDSATVRAYDSATVRAYDSATVRAYDSATVEAYGSATVRASDSATVRAYDSATVEAYGSATVRASDSATVRASEFVGVTRHGTTAQCDGGVLIQIPDVKTVEDLCDFYGLKIQRGRVVLFKAVDDKLVSGYGFAYPIGQTVKAPDWSARDCCGQGLHLSPRPMLAARYHHAETTRFLACSVKASDVVVISGPGVPDKVKVPACRVLHEVDVDGERIVEAVAA